MSTKHEHESAAKTGKHGKPFPPERGVSTDRESPYHTDPKTGEIVVGETRRIPSK